MMFFITVKDIGLMGLRRAGPKFDSLSANQEVNVVIRDIPATGDQTVVDIEVPGFPPFRPRAEEM